MENTLTAPSQLKAPYFKALVQSFYSPEVYRDAIVKWRGFGGQYLMLLAVIFAVIYAAAFYQSFYSFEKEELPFIMKQLPPITLQDGIVTVSGKQPVDVTSRDKSFTAHIDTSATPAELQKSGKQLLVGKDFVLVLDKNNNYQPMDIAKIKGTIQITEKNVQDSIGTFKLFALPLLWLGQIMNLLVKMLAVTVMTYVVTAFMREEYDFVTRMRLSILSLTPPLFITTLASVIFQHDIAPWFFVLVSCLYFYVMVVMIRRLPPIDNETVISSI